MDLRPLKCYLLEEYVSSLIKLEEISVMICAMFIFAYGIKSIPYIGNLVTIFVACVGYIVIGLAYMYFPRDCQFAQFRQSFPSS
jgi:hypothetical protein